MQFSHSVLRLRTARLAALLAAGTLNATAAPPATVTTLTTQHVDVGIAYDAAGGGWDLHVHNETDNPPDGIEYAPSEALLAVLAPAQTTVPNSPLYSFLGSAGSPVWILPQSQNAQLMFLGVGAEELNPSDWVGSLNLTLKGVSGPGDFFLWQTDSFGLPTVFMNSSAGGGGITGADAFPVLAGSHAHANWGFSAPGDYTVTFEASGTLADGNVFTASGDVDYCFRVIPEPGSAGLLGMGALAGTMLARRRARRQPRA